MKKTLLWLIPIVAFIGLGILFMKIKNATLTINNLQAEDIEAMINSIMIIIFSVSLFVIVCLSMIAYKADKNTKKLKICEQQAYNPEIILKIMRNSIRRRINGYLGPHLHPINVLKMLDEEIRSCIDHGNLDILKDLMEGLNLSQERINEIWISAFENEGTEEIIEYLWKEGKVPKIDVRDGCGRTGAHAAMVNGRYGHLPFLRTNGADFSLKNKANCTPLNLLPSKITKALRNILPAEVLKQINLTPLKTPAKKKN